MKKHHIIDLLQTGYTTIGVSFSLNEVPAAMARLTPNLRDLDNQAPLAMPKLYTYKTKDLGIAVGDRVIVKASNEFKVALVMRVDDEPQIDIDSDIKYTWIVQKLDETEYHANLARDAEALRLLVDSERKTQQQKLLGDVMTGLPPQAVSRLTTMLGHAPAPQPVADAVAEARPIRVETDK